MDIKSNSNLVKKEVNLNEFITQARANAKSGNLNLARYYLKLILSSNSCDTSMRILASAILSFIASKKRDLNDLRIIAWNLILKHERHFSEYNGIDEEQYLHYTKALCRAAKEEANFKPKSGFNLLPSFFLWKANTFTSRFLDDKKQDIKTQVKEDYLESLKYVSEYLNKVRQSVETAEFRSSILRIKDYIKSMNDDLVLIPGESFYIVSKNWITSLAHFVESFLNGYDKKYYERQNVLRLYYNNCIDNPVDELLGCFPCPINNLDLIEWEDMLYSKNHSENDFLLNDKLRENQDYIYIKPEFYDVLRSVFGSYIDIKREVIQVKENTFIETILKKLKIMIFSNIPEIRELGIGLVTPRIIQLSRLATLEDLKGKILKALQNSKEVIEDSTLKDTVDKIQLEDIKIYKPEMGLEQDQQAVEIMIAYMSKQNSFFKFTGEELNDDISNKPNNSEFKDTNSKRPKTIDDFKLANRDYIYIDITPQRQEPEEPDVSKGFLVPKTEEIICSLCEDIVTDISKAFNCQNCDQFIYCSEKCYSLDKIHFNYHNELSQMYKKQFDLSEVIIMPISKLLPSRSNKGRTGLKNLGNTCFMNSPIQCLSHCEDLTKYFLLQKFKEEINKKTKYGSGGSIATAYYSLIKEIWTGNLDYLSPWDFREIFVSFVRQFAGFIQHDSHEMLTFMLDTLHEDLNRIKEKPYQEINEKGLHEDDATAAARWWTSHLKRENSIIVDLFHGQYKSVITCPQCKRVSVTYDPFMCLSLPIPSSSMQVDLYVKLTEGFAFVRVDYKEGSTVSDVKRKVIEMLCDLNGRFGHCVDLFGSIERKSEEIQLVSVIMKSDTKTVRQIDSDRLLLSNIYENFYELALYELTAEEISRVLSTEDSSRINTRNLVFIQTAKSSNDENPLSYPLLLALNNKETTSDFRKRSLESFIKLADISNKENTLKMQILEESSELQILPNIPEKLKPKYPDCEFCNSSDCTGCLLPLSDSPMRSLISKQNLERPFILTLRLNESLSDQVCRITDIQMNATKRSKSKPRSKRLNIYDCLDFFSETEKLEKENTWYCNVCKEHQEAFKAMYIYKSPMYLIIQLKRFKVRSANSLVGSLLNRKNEALVDFPIVGLDLSNYIKASSENSVYDLIGVSQHYGNMGGGHYTATCRQDSDTWVLFDDTATSVISKDRVVDRSAYLLFYRKRLNSK